MQMGQLQLEELQAKVEKAKEDARAAKAAADQAEAVLYHAMSNGLSFKTTMGNVLTLTPPLITTVAQMDRAIDILDAALTAVAKT